MTYLILTLFLFILLLGYIRLATQWAITDIPNHRSSHQQVVVRGGGIVIPIGILASTVIQPHEGQLWYFMAGLVLISAISFLDDRMTLSLKVRLPIQLMAVALLFVELNSAADLDLGLLIIAGFICLGWINAGNFMDGINGMTVAYGLSILLSLFLVNEWVAPLAHLELIQVTAIGLLVFGFFNFRKQALCFAGDIGSISLAFVLAFLLLSLIFSTGNPLYVLFVLVYGVDSVGTIIQRLILHENIFEPHRAHLYQLLANEKSVPHLVVSGVYGLLQLVISVGLIGIIATGNTAFQWVYAVSVFALCVGLFGYFKVWVFKVFQQPVPE